MTTVLVTGGAGFIGTNFVYYLRESRPDWQVFNLDLLTYAGNPENLAGLQGDPGHTFVRGDVADRAGLDALFARHPISRVVHFAAETHVDRSILDPAAFVRTNVMGTFNLLEAARGAWGADAARAGCRFLHISTDEVFGSLGFDDPPVTEEAPYAPSSPYAASKAAADWLVRSYFRTYGLPVLITNCSNNYGPYQFPEKLIPLMILNMMEGKPLPVYGDGRNIRDWLYVEDHNRAVWLVMQQGKPGEKYNIGGENEWENITLLHTLIDLVAEETGLSAAQLRSLITFVKDRPGHDRRYAIDCSKLKQELGWTQSISFEQGLRKTVRWYLEHEAWVQRVRSGAYREWIAKNYEQRN